ncbi:MAG: hypothetical protein OEM18_06995 [Nitrosopumilus sp.]|nr:hypothetical protein [Nitrosopumilus sp.]
MSEEVTFGVSIAAIVLALASLGWQIKSKKYDVKKDYKEDYKEEIEPLLNHFRYFITKGSWASWELVRLFQCNPRISNRILQHLYTCSETRFLYDLLKKMSEHREEKKEGLNEDQIHGTIGDYVNQFRKNFIQFGMNC